MSQSTVAPSPFMFESRVVPGTTKRTDCVGIRCKTCPTEEWHAAAGPEWGRRIFKHKGWDVGQVPTRHFCPACVAKRYDPKTAPNVPSEAVATVSSVPERALPTLAQLQSGTERPAPGNSVMADKMREAMAAKVAVASERRGPGRPANPNTSQKRLEQHRLAVAKYRHGIFGRRANAVMSATILLKSRGVEHPVEGCHFKIEGEPGNFRYVVIGGKDVAPRPSRLLLTGKAVALRRMEKADKRLARPGVPRTFRYAILKSATKVLQVIGLENPVLDRDFTVMKTPEGWVWDFIWNDKSSASQVASTPIPPPAPPAPAAIETPPMNPPDVEITKDIRQPTILDNRRIREKVEEVYDEDAQRYRYEWSDQTVATNLQVPRAWVSRVRELYGPDVNDSERLRDEARKEASRAKVTQALKVAEQAIEISNTIIELAAKLETTMAELRAHQAGL